MKNITQYFVDTVKSSESTAVRSNDEAVRGTDSKKSSNGKRNRVKIKISRSNTKERVCDIVDSNNDMIDKTPSPFTRSANKADKYSHETPKKSPTKLSTYHKKLQNQDLDYISVETKDAFNGKRKKRSRKTNSEGAVDEAKKYKRQRENGNNRIGNCVSLNSTFRDTEDIDIIDLISGNSSNNEDSNSEESNVFKILMNRNKPVQQASPTELSPQSEERNATKSEEYKEKLKRSKERLIALADRKGYSKKKLAEVEEGERIEQTIQNRIKTFTTEGKKNGNMNATVLSQKQPSGSLLNYFSKTPVGVTHTNIGNTSTIVVKADVHMPENPVKHNLCSSNLHNRIRPSRKSRSNTRFPEVDDIRIIESENINISCNKKEHDQQKHSKHKWSLRIKLQTYENENSSTGNSSDEDIFSPRSRAKSNTENCKKSRATKSLSSESLSIKSKIKRASKKVNENAKLKLGKQEQGSSKDDIIMVDNEHLKAKIENKSKPIKVEKPKSTSIRKKNLNDCVDASLRNANDDNSNQENCIIIDNNSKRKAADKLAPLFTKRRKPDPDTTAARRLFLQPDITEKSTKSVDRKATVYNALPFPAVSHVTQLSNSSYDQMSSFNIPEKICHRYVPVLNADSYKCIMDFSETKLEPPKNIIKPKVQEALTEIEKSCLDAREMWDTISLNVKASSNKTVSPKTKSKRSKQVEARELVECKDKEDRTENCCWTYKYRPKSSQEVVGNEEAAGKLKEWLNGWKGTFMNEDVSSGDEFYSSDCSYSGINGNNQVAVLLGPHGSGKTASVYAVAEELGYSVLEVNASSRRTGKKLLKELEEATKSHRIKKENASGFFNSTADEIVSKKIPQNSLILIEDVDLIFKEDEGFISATYQLASNTKRPIVMTSRDVFLHLSKMAPQQNRIFFQSVVGSRVPALLELIALAETGYRLPYNCLTELKQAGDLRRAILQLQYLLLSGPAQILDQSVNFRNSFWQNMRHHLYKPAIRVSKRRKPKKSTGSKIMNDNADILNDVAGKLHNVALLSSLIDIDDSALNFGQVKAQPSLSLIENTNPYSVSSNISVEIAEWMSKRVVFKEQLNEYDGSQYQNNIELKTQLNRRVNLALSHTTASFLDQRVVSLDYLPSVRAICRAEESRANMNNKRGNRFFHYLHSLRVQSTSLRSNILTAACRVMHDKIDK